MCAGFDETLLALLNHRCSRRSDHAAAAPVLIQRIKMHQQRPMTAKLAPMILTKIEAAKNQRTVPPTTDVAAKM
jgi:hypothetical protein